ncbi:MAG: DNA repair protein RecO [Chitinophagales bacterium]|nr:DNA repair protein RecO [Chitinophagales bacterium]
MQIHNTKGIVIRTVKYGETSIIATVYTELFGIQSYMVKGVRAFSKKIPFKASHFQPAAILEMQVYHNTLKNIQFIKSYNWSFLYSNIFTDVIRNAVAIYIIEIVQHSLKQPEANPELFYIIEDTLKQIDKGNNTLVSNLPIYFTLHFCSELGFKIQGSFTEQTKILDLQEGIFVKEIPNHNYYINNDIAKVISQINNINFYNDLENIQLNRQTRRLLLQHLQQYFSLHIQDYNQIKSLQVLQDVLG